MQVDCEKNMDLSKKESENTHDIPGLNVDVYFGDAETPLPNWREVLPEDDDDSDELSEEEKGDIIGLVGFDFYDDDDDDDSNGNTANIMPVVKPSPFGKSMSSEESKPCTIGHNATRDHCIPKKKEEGKENNNADESNSDTTSAIKKYIGNLNNTITKLVNRRNPNANKSDSTISITGNFDNVSASPETKKALMLKVASDIKNKMTISSKRAGDFFKYISKNYKKYAYVQGLNAHTNLVGTLISQWADTSNGNSLARSVQKRASLLFKLNNFYFSSLDENDDKADEISDSFGDVIDDYLNAMYANTQEKFQDMGVDELDVYRGSMIFGNEDDEIDWDSVNKHEIQNSNITINPMASFSLSQDTATVFSKPIDEVMEDIQGKNNVVGIISRVKIPVDKVISFFGSGIGNLAESEIVLLGGTYKSDTYKYNPGKHDITHNNKPFGKSFGWKALPKKPKLDLTGKPCGRGQSAARTNCTPKKKPEAKKPKEAKKKETKPKLDLTGKPCGRGQTPARTNCTPKGKKPVDKKPIPSEDMAKKPNRTNRKVRQNIFITDAEAKAIRRYTQAAHRSLNEALRNGEPLNDDMKEIDNNLESVMSKIKPFSSPISVRRGINIGKKELELLADIKPGSTIKFPAYTSTTTESGTFMGNVEMKIKIVRGLDIVGSGVGYETTRKEKEFLLPKNSRFRVVSSKKIGRSRLVLNLEQIEDVKSSKEATKKSEIEKPEKILANDAPRIANNAMRYFLSSSGDKAKAYFDKLSAALGSMSYTQLRKLNQKLNLRIGAWKYTTAKDMRDKILENAKSMKSANRELPHYSVKSIVPIPNKPFENANDAVSYLASMKHKYETLKSAGDKLLSKMDSMIKMKYAQQSEGAGVMKYKERMYSIYKQKIDTVKRANVEIAKQAREAVIKGLNLEQDSWNPIALQRFKDIFSELFSYNRYYKSEQVDNFMPAVDFMRRAVSKSVSGNFVLSDTLDGRAFYNRENHKVAFDNVLSNAGTLVHEVGHHLEYEVPGLREKAINFVKSRIANTPNRKLKEVVKDSIYGDNEIGNQDDFAKTFGENASWYVGKIYYDDDTPGWFGTSVGARKGGIRSTEVISMGLEKFYNDPIGFAKSDPEYCSMIIDALRGKA